MFLVFSIVYEKNLARDFQIEIHIIACFDFIRICVINNIHIILYDHIISYYIEIHFFISKNIDLNGLISERIY